MAEKLKNLVNKMTLDYILEHTLTEAVTEKKHVKSHCSKNEKGLFSKQVIDYLCKRDDSFLERLENNSVKPYCSEEEIIKYMHKFGAILFYDVFEKMLKKKDRRYYDYMKKEIQEKAGAAEIDIDYLEKLMPVMKSLNILTGIYNKEYSLDDKEIIEFGYSISIGGSKPKEVREKGMIIPYNLRIKNRITA